ncbi:monovalent cation/H+ antiporter complex subunit F [Arcanobacterium hippocoleae]|uniref:Multicomponent Na+:H+ antiporter subunit F n=1 Tax=Arcanobacterium hippocoleae TaxID=149017 RepID=A0ABU1T2U1_9ACTO|nr:monovalent cation/H+ antiporter complex subunit F [Arcanobacterium hippocoleae]MDR6939663.1 multicomponent Na+:H+ antiporter subunit F [Arcanobacterium hippocoleae]
MSYVISSCAVLLFISALLIVYRTAKGPTALDRMVSVDMLTSIVIGGFALLAAATRRADLLPVFVAVSIIGFIGSTTLARFSAPLSGATRKALAQAAAERKTAKVQDSQVLETAAKEMMSRPENDLHMRQKYVDGFADRGERK